MLTIVLKTIHLNYIDSKSLKHLTDEGLVFKFWDKLC